MHAALEEMRSQVFALAGKYSHGRRREELERVFGCWSRNWTPVMCRANA